MPKYYIKFTGKFKDLKGLGFQFMKLYARNYKVYLWYPEGKEHHDSSHLWIWQHLGGYLEIGLMGNYSWLALKLLNDPNIADYVNNDRATYDLKNNKFLPKSTYMSFDKFIADKFNLNLYSDSGIAMYTEILSDKAKAREYDSEYSRTYVSFILPKEVKDMLIYLENSSMLEVVVDTRIRE